MMKVILTVERQCITTKSMLLERISPYARWHFAVFLELRKQESKDWQVTHYITPHHLKIKEEKVFVHAKIFLLKLCPKLLNILNRFLVVFNITIGVSHAVNVLIRNYLCELKNLDCELSV